MDCANARELLMGLIDGELERDDRAAVHGHLAGCAPCRQEEGAYRRLSDVMSRLMFREPTTAEWRAFARSTRNRLDRGFGLVLFSLGTLAFAG